ncbi:unannotated protein [freshwater metagenome]|uniref:Unannotated protein n=1 Tax=freshwater metagenome TaxID=449393 RepID=A0A6J6I6E9_9ZZZZ|nr:DUF3048 domain-containing protein [Actinomycetota bacterium]MSY38187.1 DUF3048 domain-containing protein [Actinomycetota bacterium]MSZ41212.1 DUF3048 domain-containing protein [Actinomycetota bacterium]
MRFLKTLAIAGAATTLAACSTVTSTTASDNAQEQPPVVESFSPLTGLPESVPTPVLIVKLDNTRSAQPHAGLKDADVVYVEEVEYGITRLAAVFSSTIPVRIGPTRSARITDIDLTAQYGSPAFAFSGVQRKMWPAINDSTVVDVSPNKYASAYFRDHDRRIPYNLFLNGPKVLAWAAEKGVSDDKNIGFVFSPEIPDGGTTNTGAKMKWSEASAEFTYVPASGLYNVALNGINATAEESTSQQQAATVVIQNVVQTQSKYWDKGGGNTPHAATIGSGTAIVLRDGKSYNVTWNRPTADAGTTFTMANGSPMPFKPGQQWVVLLNSKTPATLLPLPSPAPSTASKAPAAI